MFCPEAGMFVAKNTCLFCAAVAPPDIRIRIRRRIVRIQIRETAIRPIIRIASD